MDELKVDLELDAEAHAKIVVGMIQDKYGVSAERLLELAQADQAGRCLVLPFGVGDIVWTNTSVRGDHFRHNDMPYPVKVIFIGIGENGYSIHVKYSNGRIFPFCDIDVGRNVFVSCDEAMAVLQGGKPDAEK